MQTCKTKNTYCIVNDKYIVYRYSNDYGEYSYFMRKVTAEIIELLSRKRVYKKQYDVFIFENELLSINRYILRAENKVVIPENNDGWCKRLEGEPAYAYGEDPLVFGVRMSEIRESIIKRRKMATPYCKI